MTLAAPKHTTRPSRVRLRRCRGLWLRPRLDGADRPAAAHALRNGLQDVHLDKAQITDVFKGPLAVDDPKSVSVRQYDVPPGWVTPMHEHTGHMFLYIVEGSGAMETEGQVRTGAAGQVINQLPGKAMIMKNSRSSARLKFILFQIGPEASPLTVPVK